MGSKGAHNKLPDFYQNVVVMRHGDRIDNFDPSWVTNAARPWDPPLILDGQIRAFVTGRKFRRFLGYPIYRVFVSPFLRCVQTASEVVSSLCILHDDPSILTGDDVSVELGLCEMMSREAINLALAPKDGNWGFDVTEREAMLPAGTVDKNAKRVYKELPKWEEPFLDTRARYKQVLKDLADNYPTENLLLVTRGEGVGVAVSAFLNNATVYEVDYCAYVELKRPIFKEGQCFTTGEFEVLTRSGQTGVSYILPSD
ncbi:uncharacterized protein LOC129288170 isoform X2 [Prosopis cineraria]|uniref:uncharacterized protein LOC129288170 isoform X2 n=1 Tax=Prosopis cineraria TaxID=364024 RepID=UPI00240FD2B2|nr:uncharacterized protein LOC129288170 isoform X2 [Prosopis cineraria]